MGREVRVTDTLRFASAWVVVATVMSVTPAAVDAQAGRSRVEEGNRLYAEGRFAEAHQMYLEAMAEAPETPLIPFNDGNALYQDADFQRAMEGYQQAIDTGDPALASAAWYNLGNALYRQQQLEPALEAYKQSLRLNPSDTDAKHNLERVLEEMQQEQEDQNEDGDPEDQDEDEQDQQQNQDEQQDDEPQDGEQDEPQDEQDGEQPPPQQAEGEPQPEPGEMTQEEAERLLDAIDEDPGDVNRKPASARGRKPRKPW